MSKPESVPESAERPRTELSRLGLVVHPTRDIDGTLRDLRRWAGMHQAELVQIRATYDQQRVAEEGNVEECDLIVAIGGDGTTLAAIRAAVIGGRPVLPVACGSLGILTSVAEPGLVDAVERFGRGDWAPRELPALDITRELGPPLFAINDVAIVRAGTGQLRVTAEVDGQLFARIAGDGCIVSTPLGSSGYALAAGGPLLEPDLDALLITPLTAHGGASPPLVVGAKSVIRLDPTTGYGGARLELDGQVADKVDEALTVSAPSGCSDARRLSRSGTIPRRPSPTADRHRQPADPRRRGRPPLGSVGSARQRMLSDDFRAAVENGRVDQASELFRDDAIFRSPILFKPYEGRDQVQRVLQAAERVLALGGHFRYLHQLEDPHDRVAILEFATEVDGKRVEGIDKLTFDEEGRITELKVMLRPASALQAVGARMAEEFPRVGLSLPT